MYDFRSFQITQNATINFSTPYDNRDEKVAPNTSKSYVIILPLAQIDRPEIA